VIDTATNAVIATIPVESLPHGVAIDPAGARVYVTNSESDSVSVIDTATNTVVARVPVGNYPAGILVNPSGTRVYVANTYGNSVSVIDTATHAVKATLPAGSGAGGIAIDPAGTRMCVINSQNNSVSVVDAASETLLDMVPVGSHPIGIGRFIAESPAGAPRPLLVEKAGDGGGIVRSVPAGIDCGALCSHRYAAGTLVALTAVPAAGSWVSGWTGCDSAEGNRCTVGVTTSRRVAAVFSRISYPLTVVNDGAGRVLSMPRGIHCGECCTGFYGHDTLVALVATPLAGSRFVGWSGACAGADNSCQVTMDAEKGVTATFQPVPPRIAVFTPSAGAAGDRVLVTGSYFGTARGTLTFPSGAAAPIKSWISSRIEASVPLNAGSGSVTLTTADGRTATVSYTTVDPALAAVTPGSGVAGSLVTLTGVRFGSMPGTVTFSGGAGPVAAAVLHGTWHDTRVRVTVPLGVVTGDVTLTTADGNSSSRPFTVPGPAITAVTPPKGAAGTRLTLAENYFGPIPGSVTFTGSRGPVAATIKKWRAGSVELIVPDGVATGLFTLTTMDGMTDTRPFTVLPPALTRVTPGSRAPGGMVTLSGTNFGLTPGTVTFAGTAGPVAASLAPGAVWGSSSVKVTVPAGAVSGPLTLTRADGLTASRAFTVLTPTITWITPTNVVSGSVVTISGANFGETPGTVSFPGLATPVSVVLAPGTTWGNNRISLKVPPGAVAGTVTLTTAAGASASGYLTIR